MKGETVIGGGGEASENKGGLSRHRLHPSGWLFSLSLPIFFPSKLCFQTDLPQHAFLSLSPSMSKYGGAGGIRTKLAEYFTFGTE